MSPNAGGGHKHQTIHAGMSNIRNIDAGSSLQSRQGHHEEHNMR